MIRMSSARALSLKAAEGRRTPRRWRVGQGHPNLRQVLERPCGALEFPGGSGSQCVRESESGLSVNRRLVLVVVLVLGRVAYLRGRGRAGGRGAQRFGEVFPRNAREDA